MAIIWIVVFHLASRVTGMPTWISARCSRSPETRISRQRMTIAASMSTPLSRSMPTKDEQDRGDQQLVGDGIEKAAEARLLAAGTGKIAVEEIGNAGIEVDGEGQP